MDETLPIFHQFNLDTDKSNVGIWFLKDGLVDLKSYSSHWSWWIHLLADGEEPNANAVKIIDNSKMALFFHYVRERTYSIYRTHKGDIAESMTTSGLRWQTVLLLTDNWRWVQNVRSTTEPQSFCWHSNLLVFCFILLSSFSIWKFRRFCNFW